MKILITPEEISKRVAELGAELTEFYRGRDLTAVIILNGALFFGADLIRRIELPLQIDSFAASSYAHYRSTGILTVRAPQKLPVRDRHVLLIDDILDTGLSMQCAVTHFRELGAASVRSCVLMNKHIPEKCLASADWTGFHIPDHYVVGYGLDSEERYRNLPAIAVLDD